MAAGDGDLKDRIEEVADGPAEASNEVGSVKTHRISDLIAADRYLKSSAAAGRTRGLGIRLGRISPGGTI